MQIHSLDIGKYNMTNVCAVYTLCIHVKVIGHLHYSIAQTALCIALVCVFLTDM